VTVKVMMGGPSKPVVKDADAGATVATADAIATAPPPDAEELKYTEIEIRTVPPGATVLVDGAPGNGVDDHTRVTPMKVKVLDRNKDIQFTLQLDGYDEYSFQKNPKEYDPKVPINITLKKPKQGAPIRHVVPRQGSGSDGSGTPHNPTGGDLGGYPGAGSGTVPKKP